MSAFVLPPGFIHWTLSIRHAVVSRPMLITGAADVITDPFTQSNAQGFYTGLVGALQPLYDSQYTFPQLVVLVGQDGDPGRLVVTGALAGTRGTVESLPPNVCYLVSKSTGLSGRRNRGRTYLPASNEANIEQGGILTSAELTILETAANGLQSEQETGGANNLQNPVLLHSQAPTTPTPVIDHVASAFVATQRRRLVRVQ